MALPKKSLGQHFLTCEWVIPLMMDAASLLPDDTVLEIGPGTGVLTRPMARRVKRVIAVEKDEELARALADQCTRNHITNIEIHTGDILKKIPVLARPYKVVANIPYYLTARLLRTLLENQKEKPSHIVLMIQKEVAERIIAKPPHENLLAISVQAYAMPSIIKTVPAPCFRPQPHVDSAIIALSDISDNFFITHNLRPDLFFTIVRAGFAHKRKLLLNSLSLCASKDVLSRLFGHISIPLNARPEELGLAQWALLVQALDKYLVINSSL